MPRFAVQDVESIFLELTQALVRQPQSVLVIQTETERLLNVTIHVAEDDYEDLLGNEGRTLAAFHSLMRHLGRKVGVETSLTFLPGAHGGSSAKVQATLQ